jgi:hypothetical protein
MMIDRPALGHERIEITRIGPTYPGLPVEQSEEL